MPCLKIMTNLPQSKIPKDFVNRIIPVLSRSVKKPEEKFICLVSGDNSLHMFGDAQTPGAVASLESIGNLGPKENKLIIKELSAFLQNELGISPSRFFLSFYDLKDHNVGIAGTTVDTLGA